VKSLGLRREILGVLEVAQADSSKFSIVELQLAVNNQMSASKF